MGDRLRILGLLQSDRPMLASQIAFKLGLKLEVVSAHLGTMRRDGLTVKRKVYHPSQAIQMGHQVFRISQTFWTIAERKSELWRMKYLDVRTKKRIPHGRPFTGDMLQMLADIQQASHQPRNEWRAQ